MIGKIKYKGLAISGESKLLNVLDYLAEDETTVALIGDYTIDFSFSHAIGLYDGALSTQVIAGFPMPYRHNYNSRYIADCIIKKLPDVPMVMKNKLAKFLKDLDDE